MFSWANSSGGRNSVLEGHEHRTDPHDGESGDGPLDPVRRQQGDPVTLDDTVGHETGRQGGAHVLELGIRHRLVHGDDGLLVAVAWRAVGQEAGDRPSRPQASLRSSFSARRSSLPLDIIGTFSAGTATTRRGTL